MKQKFEHPKVLSESGNELFIDEQGYLLKEESKQETLEEVAERLLNLNELDSFRDYHYKQELYTAFIVGIKYQQERSYNEKEVVFILKALQLYKLVHTERIDIEEWFNKFKNK